MSDEDLIDDTLDNTSDGEDETTSQDVSEDTPSDDTPNTYCTVDDVNSMFGDISDEVSTEMFNTAIGNATTWIEANLKRNYVPIPTEHVQALKTVAIYHSASDILLTLYHGDDLPIQYDVWFNKAQSLLDDYIEAYLNSEAEDTDLYEHQMVRHSHAQTYNQRRGRWVR